MNRKKFKVFLVVTFFATLTVIGTAPMPLFAMIEGGGGTPPPPTLPKSTSNGEVVSVSGSWDDDSHVGWAMYETTSAVVQVRVHVTYNSKYYDRATLAISSTYSWKGTRTTSTNNDGCLHSMQLEVVPLGTYKNYVTYEWLTAGDNMGAYPDGFAAYTHPEWPAFTEFATHATVEHVVATMVAGAGSVFAGVAIGAFVVMVMEGMEQSCRNIPDDIEPGSSDLYGDVYWNNLDSTQLVNYGGTIGYQYAYDFNSINWASFSYTSTPTYQLTGFKIRARANYVDLGAPNDIMSIYTPYSYIYFVA